MKHIILFFLTFIFFSSSLHAQEDPYLWLEEIDGAKALDLDAMSKND